MEKAGKAQMEQENPKSWNVFFSKGGLADLRLVGAR
jgi:hypothetical protein